MTYVKKCEINVTVGNGHNMKCKIKCYTNMKLQIGHKVKLTKLLYVLQAENNVLSISRLMPNGATMWANQNKTTTKKHIVSMMLDARKVQNQSMMFYLKAKIYYLEGKEALTSLPV